MKPSPLTRPSPAGSRLYGPVLAGLLASLLSGLPSAAQAARPLITDDARIVDPGACQLEGWVRTGPGGREAWALPGCNFTGNLELSLGGARLRDARGDHTETLVVQAKTLFRPAAANDWSWGAALGASRDSATGTSDIYGYLPLTVPLIDDRLYLHANLGAKREGATGRKLASWGLGLEQQLSDRVGLIGEVFTQDKGRPLMQLGTRVWLVRDRVQIDTTVGRRLQAGSDERWISLGLRLLSPAWLN